MIMVNNVYFFHLPRQTQLPFVGGHKYVGDSNFKFPRGANTQLRMSTSYGTLVLLHINVPLMFKPTSGEYHTVVHKGVTISFKVLRVS